MPLRIDPDAFYTTAEFAELIGQTVKTLETYRSRGGGVPFCKHGGLVLYHGKTILDHLTTSERRHGAAHKEAKGRGLKPAPPVDPLDEDPFGPADDPPAPPKRPRGRPPGSKTSARAPIATPQAASPRLAASFRL